MRLVHYLAMQVSVIFHRESSGRDFWDPPYVSVVSHRDNPGFEPPRFRTTGSNSIRPGLVQVRFLALPNLVCFLREKFGARKFDPPCVCEYLTEQNCDRNANSGLSALQIYACATGGRVVPRPEISKTHKKNTQIAIPDKHPNRRNTPRKFHNS